MQIPIRAEETWQYRFTDLFGVKNRIPDDEWERRNESIIHQTRNKMGKHEYIIEPCGHMLLFPSIHLNAIEICTRSNNT